MAEDVTLGFDQKVSGRTERVFVTLTHENARELYLALGKVYGKEGGR